MEELSVKPLLGKTTRRQLVERAMEGQFVRDVELGAEVCEAFSNLYETDQEKLWANVRIDADRENWYAGAPGEHPDARPPRPEPLMRPLLPSIDSLSLEEALGRLERVRRTGSRWKALCPAHEDRRNPSLMIAESSYKRGEPVFFCHVGCTHQAVKDALMGQR